MEISPFNLSSGGLSVKTDISKSKRTIALTIQQLTNSLISKEKTHTYSICDIKFHIITRRSIYVAIVTLKSTIEMHVVVFSFFRLRDES